MTKRPYDLKLDWAEHHLRDIERLVRGYTASHPYDLFPSMEKQGRRRLYFTAQPDPNLGFMLGDVLYNVRAALDYLMFAIKPANKRGRIRFPIFWQGVWEPPVEGDSEQRLRDRRAWLRAVEGVDPQAVALIQANQPPTSTSEGDDQALAVLNRLRNKDSQQRLNVVGARLLKPIRLSIDGIDEMVSPMGDGEGLTDGAYIDDIPDDAVNVKITGTPAIVIRPGVDPGGYLIDGFRPVVLDGTRALFELLRPYDRGR